MTVDYSTLAAFAPLLLLLIGLSITVMIDPYIRREHRRVMLIIAALLVTLVAQNVLDFRMEQDGTQRMARTILGIYGYSVRPAVLVPRIRSAGMSTRPTSMTDSVASSGRISSSTAG